MKANIDAAGRIVIPVEIRRQANLQPGMEVEIHCHDGRIEIEPALLPIKLVQEGRFTVAVPLVEVPPLTDEVVEETRKALQRERGIGR